MRYFAFATTTAMLGLVLTVPSFAGTDQETFNKLIAKFLAPKNKFKPRVACVCLANNQPGYVLQVPALDAPVYCVVPTFNTDGSLDTTPNCQGEYVILGR